MIGLPANLFYNTTIPTCFLVFRAPGTKTDERKDGVLFIDASKRFTKAKNRNVLADADIADTVTTYNASFDGDGTPIDPDDGDTGLAARFVSMTEIVANGYDLSISRYIKQVAAEQADLPTLIEAYNLARAERQKTEQRMLTIFADAGIEGFYE